MIMKTVGKAFWLLVYFLSPLLPITIFFTTSEYTLQKGPQFVAAISLAITAYVWFTFQFIISARPRFIEKYFGLDKLYRFHWLMAIVALALALLHNALIGGFFHVESLQPLYGNITQTLFIAVILFSLLFLRDSVLLKIPLIRPLRELLARALRLEYQLTLFLHSLSILAATAMLAHVLVMPAESLLPFKAVMFGFYTVSGLFYLYHSIVRHSALVRQPYLVREVVQETNDVWSLKLAPAKAFRVAYAPGQFLYLKLLGAGVPPEEHPFSISSSPTNPEFLMVTIKAKGDFTAAIKNVKPQDRAHVHAPYGVFSYKQYPRTPEVFLIAGGIGITPMFSMLWCLCVEEPARQVTLLWSVKTPADLFNIPEIEQMQRQMPNFRFAPVVSRDASWTGLKGRIDQQTLASFLNRNGQPEPARPPAFFICGPAEMMDATIAALKKLGIAKKHIHAERFAY